MKILKIAALVTGIHVFALIMIFANPGCSSSTKPPPAPSDTAAARNEPAPTVSLPAPAAADTPSFAPAPIAFDPNAPAVASGGGMRAAPIRPHSPAASAVVAEPVTDVTPATTYVVLSGDSLWTIAKKFHITVAELSGANNLKASAVLKPGQKLIIPGKPAAPSVAAAANPAGGGSAKATSSTHVTAGAARPGGETVKHVVKSGETLSQIAKQYGVSLRELGLANHISDPQKVQAGTELIIPGWTPTDKAGKSAPKGGASPAKKSSPPALIIDEPKSEAPKQEDSLFTPAPKK